MTDVMEKPMTRPLTLMESNTPWPTEDGKKIHWTAMFKVHPAAMVFDMLKGDELQKLVDDIRANGLQVLPVFWEDKDGTIYLLDGRNRVEASMLANMNPGFVSGTQGWYPLASKTLGSDEDPVAYVISANIHRRHLSKKQQADLIVAARAAKVENIDHSKIERSKGGAVDGKKGGSTKDPVKEKIMADAKKAGISKTTVESAIRDHKKAKAQPAPAAKPKEKKPVTPKESLSIAEQVNKKTATFIKSINKIEGVTKLHKKNLVRNLIEEFGLNIDI